jgi:phage tail-like protein
MRNDPITAFCFKVNISAGVLSGDAFFKSVSGIKMETEVVDYRAGGQNWSTYKLVGATKWANIVLKRGFVAGNSDLLNWRKAWLNPTGPFTRATITITALDTKFNSISNGQWVFIEGWPCKWEISDFDASKNEVAIETLEIAHHGMQPGG